MKYLKIGSILLVVFLLLTACSSSTSSSGGGKSSKVVVGTWGGDYANILKDNVDPAMKKDDPNANIVYATGDQTTRMTKMQAEKGGPGTFDVIHLSNLDMQRMINANLLKKIDPSKMSNSKNIVNGLDNPYFIPHIYSASTIIYNKDKVSPAPDSWSVLWDPKYKGKIGICSELYINWVYAAAAKDGIVDQKNWDAAFKTLEQLKAIQPKVYESQEELGAAIQKGEIWATISWKARAVQWDDASSLNIAAAVPKEGTFPTVFGAAIPKNASNTDAAYKYLNAMLDPSAQAKFAEKMGYTPTVTNSKLSSDLQAKIGLTKEEQALVKPIDANFVAQNSAAWKEKLDRLLASN
jgi:putative spermidine/putrescine transport system substrate-binding protein